MSLSNIKKDLKRIKDKIIYFGHAVHCPICNSKFKKFASFGLIRRENCRCLNCDSKERHRLLWLFLNQKTTINTQSNIKLLHFAPEKIFYDNFSTNNNIAYVPCDLFPELYDYRGQTEIQKIDMLEIPYPANSFDVIICNHVLEHVPNDIAGMKEMYRVLKPDGWAILQVPLDSTKQDTYEDFSITEPKEREKAFGQDDHVRVYGLDYKERLEKAGFKVQVDDFVHAFSSSDQFKYGFDQTEMIYFCKKS